ncbi:MAG: deoxyribodipyrimidine photo-lyase [Candidatus Omnitrophica bacterium]|nr:deoxyribodipyrimidine photo-lyase [Candidatus Omnitrophota bacterium]
MALNETGARKGPVVYWMSRDQRIRDNWAFIQGLRTARGNNVPFVVIFCLVPEFLEATIRQYGFMLEGLENLQGRLEGKGIPFYLLSGDPAAEVPDFLERYNAGALITDFDPLRIKRRWKSRIKDRIDVPFLEVDAHNIVPCWETSEKQEYAAHTIRKKIEARLDEYLVDFPRINLHPVEWPYKVKRISWDSVRRDLKVDRSVSGTGPAAPGERNAGKKLQKFIENRLKGYADRRNDPNQDGQSGLSPYLHFGQLSAQRAALEVKAAKAPEKDKQAFLEELITRKELSDNFCYYNERYDDPEGFPAWARKSLREHRNDKREYVYDVEQLENALTHDDLWNAAQRQMVRTGKMHGYMRMYWAKKILEWSDSARAAQQRCIYLNDRYELDGRDPNAYAGIAWSIGGVHDRAWPERKVFGKIRYMNEAGCRRKFDVEAFRKKYPPQTTS